MTYTPTNTFVAGNLIVASQVNTNFSQAATVISDTGNGHDHDGSNSKLLSGSAFIGSKIFAGVAEQAYQQVKATTLVNGTYVVADVWTTSSGKNSTYSSGTNFYSSASATYMLAITNNTSGTNVSTAFSNPNNAYDGNESTYADAYPIAGSTQLGRTFASPRYIGLVGIHLHKFYNANSPYNVKFQTYDGATWSDIPGATINLSQEDQDVTVYYYANISNSQGIQVVFTKTGSNNGYFYVYEIYSGPFQNTGTVVTNTLYTLDNTEKGIVVYANKTVPTNTSITYSVSDGSVTISGLALDVVNNISTLGTGNLTITFNLSTSDTTATPNFSGYGVYLIK